MPQNQAINPKAKVIILVQSVTIIPKLIKFHGRIFTLKNITRSITYID